MPDATEQPAEPEPPDRPGGIDSAGEATPTEPFAPETGPVETPPRARRPRARRDVGTAWLVLLGLLLLAIIPLAVELNRPALFLADEARAVGTAIETWQRNNSFTGRAKALDPWVPVYLGQPRYDLPPGNAWLHVVAISVSHGRPEGDSARSDTRWAGVCMALLLIGSVFWAGHNIGGLVTGLLSALVAMTLPAVLFFGRLALPEIAVAAWSTLAVAASLWAMRPLRRNPSLPRQFLGWLVCGAAIGLAVLTGGTLALPGVLLPIAVLAAVCPQRVGHAMGLTAAVAIAALLVAPWVAFAHESNARGVLPWLEAMTPRAAGGTWRDYGATALWRLLAMAALCGVWVVWLIPTLVQPYSTSTGAARHRLLLGWSWLITAAALAAFAPGPAEAAPLLIIAPPAAIAIGQLFRQFHDLSAEGRHARLWIVGKWITIALTASLSLGLPAWAWLGQDLAGPLERLSPTGRPLLDAMHGGYWIGLAAALGLVAALGARFAIANHPGRAAACWAAWVLIAATVLAIPLTRGPALNTPHDASLEAKVLP